MKAALIFCGLLALSACASLSEKECQQAAQQGWEPIGLEDGRRGDLADSRLEAHREACQKVAVQPDRASYMRGWHLGVARYCTIPNAYQLGVDGGSLRHDLCIGVGDGSSLVAANYHLGRQVYELEQDIRRQENEIAELEKRRRSVVSVDAKDRRGIELEKRRQSAASDRAEGHDPWELDRARRRLQTLQDSLRETRSRPLILR